MNNAVFVHSLPAGGPKGRRTCGHLVALLFGLSLAACSGQPSPSAGSAQLIRVDDNVQISKENGSKQHWENMIAANPRNSRNLVACSMMANAHRTDDFFETGTTGYATVAYTSNDGGLSWHQTDLEKGQASAKGDGSWDPNCVFSATGDAYFVPMTDSKQRVALPASSPYAGFYAGESHVRRSTDGGSTWLPSVGLPMGDRGYVTVPGALGKCSDAVGVAGAKDDAAVYPSGSAFYASSDRGKTFVRTKLGLRPFPATRMRGMATMGAILSNGDLLQAIYAFDHSVAVMVFHNCGKYYAGIYKVANLAELPRDSGLSSSVTLAADASDGPFHDRVYEVWSDKSANRSELDESYSKDGGKHWSDPVIVDEDAGPWGAAGPNSWLGTVAVNKDGVVGVSWYSPLPGGGWVTRFAASVDGGDTFLPSVVVSSAPQAFAFDRPGAFAMSSMDGEPNLLDNPSDAPHSSVGGAVGYNYRYDLNAGDTTGLTADADGVFHPSWIDNRTGLAQLWTAGVHVNATAAIHGSPALAERKDVTQDLRLLLQDATYDDASHTMTVDARLRNVSNKVVHGPLAVRVITLLSKMGIPSVANADNGQAGRGAVWDFSSTIPSSGLPPGAAGAAKRLEFHIDAFDPVGLTKNQLMKIGELSDHFDFVSFRARVYGE